MKQQRVIILLLSSVFFVGCAALDAKMDYWKGHHQSELIAEWGPPNSTASDGNGGTILIYEEYRRGVQTPGQINKTGNNSYSYTAPTNTGHTVTRMFYVNPDGIIYSWRWQGL